MLKIHKEGTKIIIYNLLLRVVLLSGLYFWLGRHWFFYLFLCSSLCSVIFVCRFFRIPKREFLLDGENNIAAPADGTIVVIEEVMENDYFHEKRLQVSIFMSVFNAHVNWVPTNGKVIHYSYQKGRFQAAYLPKSSTENERSTIVIETNSGEKILARQIAGAMARRVVTYLQEGDECTVNQQMGFIKFGSRVDLFLPLGTDIKVALDDKVRGNETLIAVLK
ncbi:phosphatidylserine decarboxylase family protein [Bacteroidales bacterium OttesenSCG-928-I14]|nr:phosphatidylserine decarboxylase family protein [Bacteroidales bacterium OttesenSCG-928-I14]